jgi:hypothetical protein
MSMLSALQKLLACLVRARQREPASGGLKERGESGRAEVTFD